MAVDLDIVILTREEAELIQSAIKDLIFKPPHHSKGEDLSRRLRESLDILGSRLGADNETSESADRASSRPVKATV